jgi:hypothetical protein
MDGYMLRAGAAMRRPLSPRSGMRLAERATEQAAEARVAGRLEVRAARACTSPWRCRAEVCAPDPWDLVRSPWEVLWTFVGAYALFEA